MFRLIYALEKRLTRAHEFCNNVVFYLGRGHRLRDAINLAKATL